MRFFATALMLCLPLAAYAEGDVSKVNGAVRVNAGQSVRDVSTVNGSVQLEDGVQARNIATVNGSISIGAQSQVEKIETVNGGISLASRASAQRIESVNGSIKLDRDARVAGDSTTVNGTISLAKGSHVEGKLSNVNGRLIMDAAHVDGGIETVNGDITVGADSRVRGGIFVDKPSSSFFTSFFKRNARKPIVIVGPGAVVDGPLKFEREVELHVSESAKIGRVEGATPIRFSGSTPGKGNTASDLAVER